MHFKLGHQIIQKMLWLIRVGSAPDCHEARVQILMRSRKDKNYNLISEVREYSQKMYRNAFNSVCRLPFVIIDQSSTLHYMYFFHSLKIYTFLTVMKTTIAIPDLLYNFITMARKHFNTVVIQVLNKNLSMHVCLPVKTVHCVLPIFLIVPCMQYQP